MRDRVVLPVDVTEDQARSQALSLPKVAETLGGRDPRKVIYVPGRLINIVI